MDAQNVQTEDQHLVPYSLYVVVWAALVALTGITVAAYYADMAHMAVFTAVLIATAKVTLVLLYFMHVRFEKRIIAVMIFATTVTYAIFLILIFSD